MLFSTEENLQKKVCFRHVLFLKTGSMKKWSLNCSSKLPRPRDQWTGHSVRR